MSKWLLSIVAILVPVMAPAVAAPPRASPPPTTTLRSKDGTIEVALPPGWEEALEGSPMRKAVAQPDAKIVARKTGTPSFAIAFRNAKEDYTAKTLEEFAAKTVEVEAKKIADRTVSAPRKLLLGGKQAIQYEIQHDRSGVVLIYRETFTESAKHWVQIRCMTTPSHRKELDEDCMAIGASLRELPPAK